MTHEDEEFNRIERESKQRIQAVQYTVKREKIVQLAKACGLDIYGLGLDRTKFVSAIEVFAELIARHEREACAKVCDDNATDLSEGDWDSACINCADHIRARGNT